MKVYKTTSDIIIEHQDKYYLYEDEEWDQFINDDDLYEKIETFISNHKPIEYGAELLKDKLDAPLENQEIWASGVTYYNSKLGREEESQKSGANYFYARVYEAERPELFFKATKARTVASGENVRIRDDSTWDVPEPELTLIITTSGKIVGYTIGNDMSSRSIEGENPLYLPQAKCYDGSAAVGPCIYVTKEPLPKETAIEIEIERKNSVIFKGEITIDQIKRDFTELVSYLYRECTFPNGSLLMTGTGIVPSKDFTLHSGDEIRITVACIGTLTNTVE